MSDRNVGFAGPYVERASVGAALAIAVIVFGSCTPLRVFAQQTAAQPPAVPVSVGKVIRQDVPTWLRGLGTVQALNSVLIRPRVDGTLVEVPVAEGQDVKQGDLLAVIDPRPYQALLDAANAKKQQDQAQLANAQADLARYSTLARQDFASRQQLETQQSMVKQYTAAIAGDDAQIEAAQLNLSYSYITAPFPGRVGLRSIDPGNFVRSAEATSLMPLAQIKPITVTFTVPQDALPGVQDALRQGRPPVVAYSSDDKTELDRGTLLTIDNTIDATTGTIRLKASFPNDRLRLWPGQFVNMRVLIGSDAGVLTVPSQAIMHGQDRLYTYVVNADQTVSVRTVEIRRDAGALTIVTKGLEEGQQVVVDGQSRLQGGSRITNIAGTANQAVAAPRVGG